MNAQLFTLQTLHLLGDGALERDFLAVLSGLVKDCLARPGVVKKRQVSLVVDILPDVRSDGTCDGVVVGVQVASKSPAKVVPPYLMQAKSTGALQFQPDNPGNPDQGSLDLES
jgi:hypothetical protein